LIGSTFINTRQQGQSPGRFVADEKTPFKGAAHRNISVRCTSFVAIVSELQIFWCAALYSV
jgi:hypothetical protein